MAAEYSTVYYNLFHQFHVHGPLGCIQTFVILYREYVCVCTFRHMVKYIHKDKFLEVDLLGQRVRSFNIFVDKYSKVEYKS